MKKNNLKTGLLLSFVVLFPLFFFVIYEKNSLSKNEEILETIYNNELETILSSVNQYSEDVASSWAFKIENSTQKSLKHLLNTSIKCIFIGDNCYSNKNDIKSYTSLKNELDSVTSERSKQLKQFFKRGYRKIESYNFVSNRKLGLLYFMIKSGDKIEECKIITDIENFILDYLSPKIQNIAKDKFIISIFDDNDQLFFPKLKHEDKLNTISSMKVNHLWMLDSYKIGIRQKKTSVKELVNRRRENHIIILIVFALIYMTGAWIIFRNIRNQIQLAQMKSEFVSNVSHEIRTPLTIINMYAETLEVGHIPTEQKKKEYYKIISRESRRLSNIVNKILLFSNIGKKQGKIQNTYINNEILHTLEAYQYHLDKNKVTLKCNFTEKMPSIKVEEEAIGEILRNLMDNAIKYGAEQNKMIEISTGVTEKYQYFSVKDNGIGISKKNQKYIFDKFFRVTKSDLAYKAKGSGIGLNIVRELVDSHKGKIELDSKIGMGSSFKIFLPIYQ